MQAKHPQLPQPFLTCAPDPSLVSLLFSGFAAAPQCPCCSEEPRTQHNIEGVASPVLSVKGSITSLLLRGPVVIPVQDAALCLVEPHSVGLGPSIQLSRSLCRAFLPSSRSTFPPLLVSSVNLLRVHTIPLSRSLMKMLKTIGPNTEPWGAPRVTKHKLDVLHSPPLSGHSNPASKEYTHPHTPQEATFSWRMLWETEFKLY